MSFPTSHAYVCYGNHVGEEIGVGNDAWYETFGNKSLKLREQAEMDSPQCDVNMEPHSKVRVDKVKEIEGLLRCYCTSSPALPQGTLTR